MLFAIQLLHERVMLINSIERFNTFNTVHKLHCVVVTARQTTKEGKQVKSTITTLKLYTKKRKTNITRNSN